jgi:hypothetical protein
MTELPDVFLHSLADRLDGVDTLAVSLGGSFARGEGSRHSDIDLHCYLRLLSQPGRLHLDLHYEDDYLVSVWTTTLEDQAESLADPQRAIWTIPGLRQERILIDKDGRLGRLQAAARNATWESLQPAANRFASRSLAQDSEEVLKILAGLEREDESRTLYALWSLTRSLSESLMVQHGTLVTSENVYLDLAQQAAGRGSAWSRWFRLAVGLDAPQADEPPYRAYAAAGLELYRESARLLQPFLGEQDRAVIGRTLEMIKEAGY